MSLDEKHDSEKMEALITDVLSAYPDKFAKRRKKHAADEEAKKIRDDEREKILAGVPKAIEALSLWDRLLGKKKAA